MWFSWFYWTNLGVPCVTVKGVLMSISNKVSVPVSRDHPP